MRDTRLILIEGLPGSGKSTTAQFLTRTLTKAGIANRWWYEEEKGHPVYLFHDVPSLQQTLQDLADGDYRRVIAAALDKWQQFSDDLRSSDTVVLLDSCLFGYLTWTLFPFDVPSTDIRSYIAEVERIISSHHPCLIYFYQDDLSQALERICDRRGGDTRDRFIRNATQLPYGERRGLQGSEGMVTFWAAYRALIDTVRAALDIPALAIENAAGDWQTYQREVVNFLALPLLGEESTAQVDLEQFAGVYIGGSASCTVWLDNGGLVVDGLPHVWPRSRLILRSDITFDVESLPLAVTFVDDAFGTTSGMVVSGPELLLGKVDAVLVKEPG